MMELNLIQKIAIFAIPVIFAITLHEAAHGFAAKRFGDNTAYVLGRISLNPLRHIDPFGTVILPLLILVLSKLTGGAGILFGWAKPVPVDYSQLKNPKRDMLWVAAAGPGANFFMALIWILIIRFGSAVPDQFFSTPLALMGAVGVMINTVLMVLNLFPLPPLDGGRILISLLPNRMAWNVARLEPYGFMILLVLLFTGVLGAVMWPFIGLVLGLLAAVSGVDSNTLMQLINVVLS